MLWVSQNSIGRETCRKTTLVDNPSPMYSVVEQQRAALTTYGFERFCKMKIAAIAIVLFPFALFAIAETSAEQTDPVLIIRETFTVDNEGLKDNHGKWVNLSRFREVHLDGDNATIVASVIAPRLIGHPDGTTIRAVGKVKDGKMYYQKSARNAHIQNIIFDGNKRAWDAPRGVWIDGGQGTTISNCAFQNVSHSGLTVLGEHAQLVVRGCTFKNISWPEMVISSAQGVQAEFKISDSTGTVDEGWLKRPTNALMERWLTGRWTAQDIKQHGVRGYHRQLYPMDVGYLHGIYLTGKQHDVLIDNCSFENINWGFGINITGGSHSVIVSNCRFEKMGKGCLYVGDSDSITVTEFDAVDCAALLHLPHRCGLCPSAMRQRVTDRCRNRSWAQPVRTRPPEEDPHTPAL